MPSHNSIRISDREHVPTLTRDKVNLSFSVTKYRFVFGASKTYSEC